MADARTMMVQTESGDTYPDPSGGLLWVLLEPVGTAPDYRYLMMFADGDEDSYLFVSRTESGGFLARFQDGPGHNFVVPRELTFDETHTMLLRWGFGRTSWRDLEAWSDDPEEYGEDDD